MPTILLPLSQDYSPNAIVMLRTERDAKPYAEPVALIVRAFDRGIPVEHVITMEDNVKLHFAPMRMGMVALSSFAVVACLLSAIGLYAVLTTYVRQRHREFAIRMALGAMPQDVVRKVMAESALMALCGGGLGIMFSLGIAALLRSSVTTINPFEVSLYAVSGAAMFLTVILSTLQPILTASKMQPSLVLRTE